jgi:phosphinothricin acetyltransferase
VYIGAGQRGKGIGDALLQQAIAESEKNGIWTLQSGIFPENTASVRIHEKNGFRVVGIREKIGKMGDIWRDNLLLERRNGLD